MPIARRAVLYSLLLTTSVFASIITGENNRPGTDQWMLRNPPSFDIAGYASHTSVEAGETLKFHVSSPEPYTLEIFRLGWYRGKGGRQITDAVTLEGSLQPTPAPDADGMIRCNWPVSHSIKVPQNWVSGVYLAKLTTVASIKQNYVMFVVRDKRKADLLFQSAVTTFQAYNNWGGKSLYRHSSSGGVWAKKVSFDRPYSAGHGPFNFLWAWEYNMVRFLEREGYDVTYSTNIDTHARPETLHRVRAFLSVGHDEYWSWEMRANVEAARAAGIDLGFFSANTCYWQIRLEDDLRTIVGHKETALSTDPILFDGNPSNDHRATTLWRDVPVNRPEEALLGVMYLEAPVNADIVIDHPSHWVFANTGLKKGDRLVGLLGYEVDAIFGMASPPGLVRLAHSPFVSGTDSGFSDMTIYTHPSGAIVFATGTIQWSWGLDDYNKEGRGQRTSPAAQQITRNVLDEMIGKKSSKRRSVRR